MSRPRSLAALLVAALLPLLLGGPPAGAATADTAGQARLRLGHFATGLGELTVEAGGRPLASGLTYGEVTEYQPVPAGTVTVTFRAADAAAGSPPAATTELRLAAGESGSALVAGEATAPLAKSFLDDLSAPPAGSARVRLVHMAPGVPAVDARVRQGVRLFADAVYGETSEYVEVPEGAYDLEMLRAGTDQVLLAVRGVTVASGSVYTMVGTGGGEEPVEVRGLLDAAGAGATPAGGVATGLGGTAPGGPSPGTGTGTGTGTETGTAAVAALAVLAAALGLRRRRAAGPAGT